MHIEPGVLVKTLRGTIVKTERQTEPGYWFCDDGRTYLAAAFSAVSEDERTRYAASNPDQPAASR